MLTIFRRHRTGCPHKSRRYRRCQCAIWIEGLIGDEKVRRQSLNFTSWEAAEDDVRESNRAGKLGSTVFIQTTIADAVDLYPAGRDGTRPRIDGPSPSRAPQRSLLAVV